MSAEAYGSGEAAVTFEIRLFLNSMDTSLWTWNESIVHNDVSMPVVVKTAQIPPINVRVLVLRLVILVQIIIVRTRIIRAV